ncbi:hypothetical protein J2W36_005301, partial [Variovorax ginsengisoli]|nr:hypothetical protein [Variovorax ginsengisoli]
MNQKISLSSGRSSRGRSLLRAGLSALVLAGLAACSSPEKPKPVDLPPVNAALLSVRQAWTVRIPEVSFPLQTDVSGDV